MILKSLHLKNFRNFSKKDFYFNPFLTVIVGENSRGKTNLLEAIFVLLNGKGFRESREQELIMMGKLYAIIEGIFGEKDENFKYRVSLEKKDKSVLKKFFLEGSKVKFIEYRDSVKKGVIFSPYQIEIITGSPEIRRRYVDSVISLIDLDYKQAVINYEAGLRRRNKVLESNQALEKELSFC